MQWKLLLLLAWLLSLLFLAWLLLGGEVEARATLSGKPPSTVFPWRAAAVTSGCTARPTNTPHTMAPWASVSIQAPRAATLELDMRHKKGYGRDTATGLLAYPLAERCGTSYERWHRHTEEHDDGCHRGEGTDLRCIRYRG